tara:strand:- start:3145 stop:4860 length:1716 start_codon:yes stop_codon:yes gene_type:complete
MDSEIRIGMLGSVDSGKCFGINTPILMYDRSIKMIQDVKIRDKIMADDNINYKQVLNTIVGKTKMYKVIQTNGIDYVINKYHILTLKLHSDTNSEKSMTLYNIERYLINNLNCDYVPGSFIVDISITDYLKLPSNYIGYFYGIKGNSNIVSKINIEELGEDVYYGISFGNHYSNRRFLLSDNTIVHNSTLTGVISKNILDNGRGLARSLVLKHPHEKESGRTSAIVQHYLRNGSDKVTILVDLAGHEKYLKTTISGVSKCYIDYACVVIAANMGVLRMTKEHIGILVGLEIPFFIILTKIDMCPENVRENTIKDINTIFERFSKIKKMNIKKQPIIITDENYTYNYNINEIPIFPLSSVRGDNVDKLKKFIYSLDSRTNLIKYKDNDASYIIESVYVIKGIGYVVSGLLISGKIKLNDQLYLGPYYGKYFKIQIKSIHNNFREQLTELEAGNSGCLNFKFLSKEIIKRNSIRKGVKILQNPILIREFEAKVKILYHHTSIKQGYQPLIHCGNISQIATIKEIDNKLLRLYDEAVIRFRFRYYPEYIEEGVQLLFREGKTKGTGIVTKIYQE